MRQQLNTEEIPPGMGFLASQSVDWYKPPQAPYITSACWIMVRYIHTCKLNNNNYYHVHIIIMLTHTHTGESCTGCS